MAFAQTTNNSGAPNPFITEKDLIRQVASNITKEALVVTKPTEDGLSEKLAAKSVGDSKRLMTENTAKALKVWYAFVKFVKNQVTVNGRLVDTQLIGLFGKDHNGDVLYMPSPDYLEAGKYKLQKGIGSLCHRLGMIESSYNLLDDYRVKYQEKLQTTNKGELAILSYASLSLVTNSTKEQVKRVLTDLFTALVDVSRKTGKEAHINMKGFGKIYLFKNRELAFNAVDDSIDLSKIDAVSNNLFLERQKAREDLSFVDQASAVLSRGGGMAYSVKSSALSSLSSVMTAPTNPSVRSSVIQSSRKSGYARSSYSTQTGGSRRLAPIRQDAVWAKYKQKNQIQAKEREMRKSHSVQQSPPSVDRRSVASLRSNYSEIGANRINLAPNAHSINMRAHTNAPTTIADLQSSANVFLSPEQTVSNKSANLTPHDPLPYPFMSGFVDRKMGNRFSKRVVFDRSDYDDLLGKIIDQIHEKRDRELLGKIDDREEEQGLLEYQREQMHNERQYERADKTHKTNAFIQANQILKDEKQDRSDNEIRMKSIERVSYFPFTHGDMIETQRKALNELQKHEQLNAIKERAHDEMHRKRNQARLNAEANEQMLLSFQKQVIEEQMDQQRKKIAKRSPNNTQENYLNAKDVQDQKSNGTSPSRPNLFLKNSSATLPPRRQQLGVSNSQIQQDEAPSGGNQYQLAMSEALARHEAEVMKVGALRKIQEQDFRAQVIMQDQIVKAEHEQEQFKKVQLYQELNVQMKEGTLKKEAEKMEKKEKIATTGGPTMESEDVGLKMKKIKDQQNLTKLSLTKQKAMEDLEKKVVKEIAIEQERKDAERIAAKHFEAKQIKEQQKREQLEHFKAVWEAQKSIKQQSDAMDNCF